MVKVKALQRIYYGGKEHAKDDEFEVSEREAVMFGALHKVMRSEQPEASTEPAAADATSDSGKYRRRDQRAED